jgi:hypothetical protein
VRRIRDEIAELVRALVGELLPARAELSADNS